MDQSNLIKGHFVDIFNRKIYPAAIQILNGKIVSIQELLEEEVPEVFMLPGFVDAHIHIESSMLTPPYFAAAALPHGTVATISDPHEIANVCGVEGVSFMLKAAKEAPLKFHFGAPSCVPATTFETAGAVLNSEDVQKLMQNPDIYYLSEVMNFPAVLNRDEEMMSKINAAQKAGKPVDGHAPGMRFPDTETYFSAGISTDHECFTLEEALDKIEVGCKILIREGSAAKNFEALKSLFQSHPDSLMLCSDDLHPDDLLKGHINLLVKRALKEGFELFDVLYAACIHPVLHYNLKVGMLRVGDDADFIVVKDLKTFAVQSAFINGEEVVRDGKSLYIPDFNQSINQFNISDFNESDLKLKYNLAASSVQCRIIEALDGQLITRTVFHSLPVEDGIILPDIENDILKIVVINRYQEAKLSVAWIKNFGLKDAAIASTVAHDSHNIVVVGTDDDLIAKAVRALIRSEGGIVYVDAEEIDVLPLAIGGLMSNASAEKTGAAYERLTQKAKNKRLFLASAVYDAFFYGFTCYTQFKDYRQGFV